MADLAIGILGGISYTSAIAIVPATGEWQIARIERGCDVQDDLDGSTFAVEDVATRIFENPDFSVTKSASVHCVLALSGIDHRFPDAALAALTGGLTAFPFSRVSFQIRSLPEACHLGAFLAKPGVLVRCGHGSSAFIVTRDNSASLVGGWGNTIGDPGCGPSLGRQAVSLVARTIDNTATDEEREFVRLLLNNVSFVQQQASSKASDLLLYLAVHRPRVSERRSTFITKRYLTTIAREVISLAHSKNEFAQTLVAKAIDNLYFDVRRILSATSATARLPLCLRGSMIEFSDKFASDCMEYALTHLPCVRFCDDGRNGMYSPEVGVGLLALQQSHHDSLSPEAMRFLEAVSEESWAAPEPTMIRPR